MGSQRRRGSSYLACGFVFFALVFFFGSVVWAKTDRRKVTEYRYRPRDVTAELERKFRHLRRSKAIPRGVRLYNATEVDLIRFVHDEILFEK